MAYRRINYYRILSGGNVSDAIRKLRGWNQYELCEKLSSSAGTHLSTIEAPNTKVNIWL
ncbi:MAG: hypothetical protein ACLTE2_03040 [Eubacteriales bacterium]